MAQDDVCLKRDRATPIRPFTRANATAVRHQSFPQPDRDSEDPPKRRSPRPLLVLMNNQG